MKIILSVVLALVVTTGQAWAGETYSTTSGAPPSWLKIDKSTQFYVAVRDEVKGGCWTNSTSVKNAIVLELTRSGYEIVDEIGPDTYDIYIFAFGSKTENGLCMVSIELIVERGLEDRYESNDHVLRTNLSARLWSNIKILWGGNQRMNQRIKEQFVELIQTFLVFIPQEQKRVLKKVLESEYTSSEAKAYWSKFKID